MGNVRELTCPAAALAGEPHGDLPSVVCGIIRNANRGEEVGGWTHRGRVNDLVDARQDPSSIAAFCTGQYVECPIWQAERDRVEAGRPEKGGLHSPQHEERSPGRIAALDAIMSGMRRAA